jgi:HD-GYP domain-containing protein (c-di-GMP phosphodiesterase class II)
VILVWPKGWRDPEVRRTLKTRLPEHPFQLVFVGGEKDFAEAVESDDPLRPMYWCLPLSGPRLGANLHYLFSFLVERHLAADQQQLVMQYKSELDELVAISRVISSERNIDKLLGLILAKSREVTGADAGSVYVVEGRTREAKDKRLHFKVTQNDSVEMDFREFTMEVSDKSIVGNAVLRKSSINIPDLYALQPDNPWGVTHDKSFDERMGYESHSMLTVPMLDRSAEVIGVIQLINKKRDPAQLLQTPESFGRQVVPFDQRSEELAVSLAAQAGISLENALLYDEVRRLFEGFVHAAVTAIESRDPTTSGHSVRVAKLTCALAEQLNRETDGPFADIHYTSQQLKELEYAGLLHDFGKVGVRENVLTKANKLYEEEKDLILLRFDFIRSAMENELNRRKLELVKKNGLEAAREQLAQMDDEFEKASEELNGFLQTINEANRPSVLAAEASETLDEVAGRTYTHPDGESHPFLTDGELECLKIPRGSLTAGERTQIESHVEHTYNFLKLIPWGRNFSQVPFIASRHHEKLDGTGYPQKLSADGIPLRARMMAIADIFDALTASDRPYKKAMPLERALKILGFEANDGKLDSELLMVFVEREVYKAVLPDA